MTMPDEWRPLEKPEVRAPQTPVTPEREPEEVAEVIDLGERREKTPETPATTEDHVESRTPDDLLKKIVSEAKVRLMPPDVYHDDRPSLRKVIEYGWSGAWGPEAGPWRTAGKIYAVAVFLPIWLLYTQAWCFERGSRLAAEISLLVSAYWLISWLG